MLTVLPAPHKKGRLELMEFTLSEHIQRSPEICGGKPCVAGTRVRVWDIHVWHDLNGRTPEEIVASFPQVSVADVHAALAYYHDNREPLEKQNQQAEERVRAMSSAYSSKLPNAGCTDPGDAQIPS